MLYGEVGKKGQFDLCYDLLGGMRKDRGRGAWDRGGARNREVGGGRKTLCGGEVVEGRCW